MDEFRRQFTIETVAALEHLSKDFENAADFSDTRKREFFRTLHTVKGTAQTFGYRTASRLAHQLEHLLARLKTKDVTADDDRRLFSEGVEHLIRSLKERGFAVPDDFTHRINSIAEETTLTAPDGADDFPVEMPGEFLSQLSVQEKTALRFALRQNKNLFCLAAEFQLSDFAERLIALRETLAEFGEIIATLPGEGDGEINFCVLLASAATASEMKQAAEKTGARIVFDSSPVDFPSDAPGVLAHIVRHGQTIADRLGKRIQFHIIADATMRFKPDRLKLVFDVLLHLVRNAVDHAFDEAGEIKITLQPAENGSRLIVADDGNGIDAERLKRKAVENNLVAGENLTERETLDLIFLPELSIKTEATEVSGRGVGLDAVKSAVERIGATINVQSQPGRGTTFEIFLPQ